MWFSETLWSFFYAQKFMMVEKLKQKVLAGMAITTQEAMNLATCSNKQALYDAANEIREKLCGNKMDLCSITNAKSGNCSENCKWCSQSAKHKTNIEKYSIVNKEQAVKEAIDNRAKGVHRHSLVCSGHSASDKLIEELIPIYKEIRAKSDMAVCASMGLLKKKQLQQLKEQGGIDHYHCNLETAPSIFHRLCSTHTIEDKIETIKYAQELGINVCSGGIIGMGETIEHRIELAFTLRDLNIQSIPINILNPIEGTALENQAPLSEEEILTCIALFRFINPTAKLRFAGGRMQLKAFEDKALKAGINSALTGDYLTTTGSDIQQDVSNFTKQGFEIN